MSSAVNTRIFNEGGEVVDGAQAIVSDIISLPSGSLFSLHFQWTGALTGQFKLYRSNILGGGKNINENWVEIPATELDFTATGANADPVGDTPVNAFIEKFVNVGNSAAAQYLLVYTNASGTGTMQCTVNSERYP